MTTVKTKRTFKAIVVDDDNQSDPIDKGVRKTRQGSDYKALDQISHILKRSSMYIGSSRPVFEPRRVLEIASSTSAVDDDVSETASVATETASKKSKKVPVIEKRENAMRCDGLERLFIEIVSNSADNIINTLNLDPKTPSRQSLLSTRSAPISVTIEGDKVTVKNGGEPIPVMHSTNENSDKNVSTLIPDFIFGQLFSSSNYDEDQIENVGSGTNGVGCKLSNIFSKRFHVKIGDPVRHQTYIGEWENSMGKQVKGVASPGYVKDKTIGEWVAKPSKSGGYSNAPFVEISYNVDFDLFPGAFVGEGENRAYHPDTIAYFARYLFDLSFTLKFPISFNGVTFDSRTPRAFAKMYFPESQDRMVIHYEWPSKSIETNAEAVASKIAGNKKDAIAKAISARSVPLPTIELIVIDTPDNAEALGFVNSIFTPEGVHVNESIVKCAAAIIAAMPTSSSKDKEIATVNVNDAKNHFSVIVNAYLKTPKFSSQTKTCLTEPRTRVNISPSDFKLAMTSSSDATKWGVVSRLTEVLSMKVKRVTSKTDAGKRKSRVSIEQGEDANHAGTAKSQECVLYLVEGESAAAQIKLRISLTGGKDFNGYFPMKGKSLNVTSASASAILANKELNSIKTLVGLADGADYSNINVAKLMLRYGKILIASDQDVDGMHIRALVTNMFAKWPTLFQSGRIGYLATPLVRIVDSKTRKCTERFFCEASFDRWLAAPPNNGNVPKNRKVVYLKGLASSTSQDIKDDLGFSPCIVLLYDDFARESLNLAFDSKRANDRKRWILDWKSTIHTEDFEMQALSDFMKTNKTGSKSTVPTGQRPISHMINSDLAVYSSDTLFRAIPSTFDGFKKSQRQAIFHCLEYWGYGVSTSRKEPLKIARLASATAERVQYAHGEVSLCSTLIGMAQDFIGSNNVTVLDRVGQFGTRSAGGADAGAPRYISTTLDESVQYLFTKESVSIAKKHVVEGEEVEPVFLPSDLPVGIINGCRGIATGYATLIPSHNPVEIADWLLNFLKKKPTTEPLPWFRGFKGVVRMSNSASIDDDVEDDGAGNAAAITNRQSVVTEGIFTVTREPSKKDPTYDLTISELPIQTWTSPYRKMLEAWIDEGKLGDLLDNSTTETVMFTLKGLNTTLISDTKKAPVKSTTKNKQPEAAFPPPPLTIELLKLRKTFSLNSMVTIDDDGNPLVSTSINDILTRYANRMLDHYEKVRAHRIQTIEADLAKAIARHALIEAIVTKKLLVFDRHEDEILANINKLKLSEDEFDTLKMRDATKDKLEVLRKKIADLSEQLKATIAFPSWKIWEERVISARKFFSKQR